MSATEDRIRIGLVGAGAIAQLAHLPVLSKIKNAELVAICDNDGPKARSLADRFEVPDAFTDIDDMLDFDQLDAILISSPTHLHEPHVLAALKAKLHVFCERPLSLTSKGVERILAAANKVDRKVVIGNNHRFRSDVQQLYRFIKGGELGAISGIRAGQYQFRGRRDGWRHRKAEAGGGVFLDFGFTLVDMAMWLADFPDPVRVSAHMERGKGANAVEDSMVVQLEFAGGLVTSFDVSWNYVGTEERWWFETLAARGSARLAPLRVIKNLNGKPTDVSPTGAAARESVFLQSYRAELTHFIAVLRGEVPYEVPNDQLIVQKIVEAIYKSAEEGREIKL